jgi:hypothetical protein
MTACKPIQIAAGRCDKRPAEFVREMKNRRSNPAASQVAQRRHSQRLIDAAWGPKAK